MVSFFSDDFDRAEDGGSIDRGVLASVGIDADNFSVCYRLKGAGEHRSCRVYRRDTTQYGEWFENYCDGPTRCHERLNRIEAAANTIDAIVDGIIAVRVAEAELRETLNYDGLHNEMHPLAYEVTEARERRR